MRFSLIGLGALALGLATPALADPLPAAPAAATDGDTAPPAAITIDGSATIVTDYRFRGLSQSDRNFALQGGITVTHTRSGVYLSAWGSSIDDYVAGGGDAEIDLIGGWKKAFGGTTLDIGAVYYLYPGSGRACACKYYSDFVEPYVSLSHTLGPVTAKATLNYAPPQRALALGGPSRDNLYGALDLSTGIPATPLSLSAHLGHNFDASFLSAGRRYTDWGLGVAYTWKRLTFGVNYVDTDLPRNWATSLSGKDVARAGILGSVGISF
jgi:uncharacterized protein (TIGR02001 family)